MTRLQSMTLGIVGVALVAAGTVGLVWYLPPTTPPQGLSPGPVRVRETREVPPVRFTDVTADWGIHYRHENGYSGLKLLPETMGGGVACFDFDGDGLPDILFVGGRPWPGRNPTPGADSGLKLYRNRGQGQFEDVTQTVGLAVPLYGMGVTIGDFDNDGYEDIFISCVGQHRLFRNIAGKRFVDVTEAAGLGGLPDLPNVSREAFDNHSAPIPFGSSCTFLDYDGDGLLDLFVCHYVTWSPLVDRSIASSIEGGQRTFVQPRDFDGALCTLYRNVDGQRFEDVSATAGVHVIDREGTGPEARSRPVGKALGVTVWDADGDGWPDVLVANDTVRNFFFHNVPGPDGTRRFAEKGYPLGAAYADEGKARGGMGIDWGFFTPLRSAAVIANFANEPLTFLERDRKRLAFSDSAMSVGLAGPSRATLKFGTFFFDYDNDGRLDLLVCNGHIEPEIATIQASQTYAQPAQLFWNTGDAQCYYEPVTHAQAGADLFAPLVGRGCAFADLDGDGDLDVVLVANGDKARVLRNDAPATHRFVRLDLRGDGRRVNRSAIGAVVTLEVGDQTLTRVVAGARGYLSQSELPLTVGIGAAGRVDRVRVRWPGKDIPEEMWTNLEAGQTHRLMYGKGTAAIQE